MHEMRCAASHASKELFQSIANVKYRDSCHGNVDEILLKSEAQALRSNWCIEPSVPRHACKMKYHGRLGSAYQMYIITQNEC